MKTTIDAAGRVVVPKPLRDRLHLGPGVELEIAAAGDGILLRPADRGAALVEQDGVLVHRGPGTSDIDVAAFIRRERDARARSPGSRRR